MTNYPDFFAKKAPFARRRPATLMPSGGPGFALGDVCILGGSVPWADCGCHQASVTGSAGSAAKSQKATSDHLASKSRSCLLLAKATIALQHEDDAWDIYVPDISITDSMAGRFDMSKRSLPKPKNRLVYCA